MYLVIAVPCYVWIQAVLRKSLEPWVTEWSAIAQGVVHLVGGSAAIGAVLYLLVRFVIGDPLLERRFRAAEFYQGEFPSGKIAKMYNLASPMARQLWRDYYDTWQFRASVNFEKYLATTFVGYQCRAVVLLRILVCILGTVGLAIGEWQHWNEPVGMFRTLGFWLSLVYLVGGVLLFWWHRLPGQGGEPTGCWATWRVRNEENLQTFIRDLGGRDVQQFWQEVAARLAELRAAARGK